MFHGAGKISIGDNCWIGLNTSFYTLAGTVIRIEENCDIAPRVILHSGSHHTGGPERRAGELLGEDITIGAGSWISAGATILPGVTLGRGTIVAAGAVVSRGTYEPNVILGGVPARVIRVLDGEALTSHQ